MRTYMDEFLSEHPEMKDKPLETIMYEFYRYMVRTAPKQVLADIESEKEKGEDNV